MNVADRQIVELVAEGDLVITADIPLAADVVNKGAQALDPRGELYTDANVGERLATRNLIDQMRGAGQIMGGPSNFTTCNRQAFANWTAPPRASASGAKWFLTLRIDGRQVAVGVRARKKDDPPF
jgi:uncharacterized protein YaiI (UPF0178 family)